MRTIGDQVVLTFTLTTPGLAPGEYMLVKKYHRSMGTFSGQESSSGYDIEVKFRVGAPVPEFPFALPVVASSCDQWLPPPKTKFSRRKKKSHHK